MVTTPMGTFGSLSKLYTAEDLGKVKELLDLIKKPLTRGGHSSTETYIAGGFLTRLVNNEPISEGDIDVVTLYGCDSDLTNGVSKLGFEQKKTDRAYTFTKDERCVQILRHWYGEPSRVLRRFDVNVSCFFMYITTGEVDSWPIRFGHDYLYDYEQLHSVLTKAKAKELVMGARRDLKFYRLEKFLKRGYVPGDEDTKEMLQWFLHLSMRAKALGFKDINRAYFNFPPEIQNAIVNWVGGSATS